MKQTPQALCKLCGEHIEWGWLVNPTNSDVCDACYRESKEKDVD